MMLKTSGAETGGSLSHVETIDPRGTAKPLHVHCNEEEGFVDLGVDASGRPEPPDDAVFPPVGEVVRAFAPYGWEILGSPPAL